MVVHPTANTDTNAGHTNPTSVTDVITSVNTALRDAGGAYSTYSCKTVSWDDVQRGTVGGSLSAWGGNITDTRLYAKSGQQLYTVRAENFNEKLGCVSADEVALIAGNQTPGGGALTPITLKDVLKNFGAHGGYAGVDKDVSILDGAADAKVSIRFMTTFLPVADEALATMEFAPEMYQYQTRTAEDPANLLLLATTQGFAVQANGAGATKLFHHAVEPNGKIARYWFEAERSTKQVGGAQQESKEEALAAAARGKATAAVIGTRAMGTRFNVLMTIQVPLVQQPKARPRGSLMMAKSKGVAKKEGGGGGGSKFLVEPECGDEGEAEEFACFDEDEDSDDDGWCMDAPSAPPPMVQTLGDPRKGRRAAGPPPASRSRVGKANAARVSRGSMADRVERTVEVKRPKRDPSQHVTVTVVIYNTVAGGVPSAEDVRAAVDDMERLYASCGWHGRLAEGGADFMKQELTVKDAMDITDKLTTQPYVPPAGAIGLVNGGGVFPTSVA